MRIRSLQRLVKYTCAYRSYSTKMPFQSLFDFTHAITRGIPKSFAECAVKSDTSQEIDLSRAVQQMNNYISVLKQCGLKVITLPADEKYPDCLFVEDMAVVIGQKACLTQPGHPSRRGEVEAMKDCLESLAIETHNLDNPAALLDGGDVMFTGQEILVGLSGRSNKAGVDGLQKIFPEFPVTPVPVTGALHLKSVATLAQEGVIAVGGSKPAKDVLKALQTNVQGKYLFIQLKEDKSANVLFLNGHAIIKPESDLGQDFQTLTSGLTVPWIAAELDEMYKADGCLTCCSILLQVLPAKE